MPDHCCVPSCRSNYKGTTDYVSVFRFPKNAEQRELWLQKIRREDFVPGDRAVVCERHFPEEMIIRFDKLLDKKGKIVKIPRKVRRLISGAYPIIFPTPNDVGEENKPSEIDLSSSSEIKVVLPFSGEQNKKSKVKALSIHTQKLSNFSESKASVKLVKAAIANSKSLKKTCTTNRPIITIVKAEDVNGEKQSSNSNEKQLDIVKAQCENYPDSRLPFPIGECEPSDSRANQEEKRICKDGSRPKKRSSSVGSNSSSGSIETTKSASSPKRRKIEKPPPTVLGRENDCYCWVCHKEGIVLCCISCPRAYHLKCAGEVEECSGWVCVECRRVLSAENVDSRSTTLSKISLNKLCALLKLSLNKMKYRAPAAFHQPVPVEYYPSYPEYVIHPVDLSLIEKNIKQKMYGCTESFLADVKWILHNSSVFNGTQHPLSTNAKSLVKTCEYDMGEIEVCPDCYMHSCIRSKYWFSDVCNKPHPLVWAKLKGFPYWPAKVVRIVDGNVDARFFGAHDRAWVPVSQCYHLSKEMPTSSKPKKKGTYDAALDELNVHVQLLMQKYGTFIYAPYRTPFDPENKVYSYHGIDIDKIVQMEDDSFDPASINFKHLPKSSVSAVDLVKQEETKPKILSEVLASDSTESKPPGPKLSGDIYSSELKHCVSERKTPPVGVFEVSNKVHVETPQKLELLNTSFEIKLSPAAFTNNNQKIVSALERIKEIVCEKSEEDAKIVDSFSEDKEKGELNKQSICDDTECAKITENTNSNEPTVTNTEIQGQQTEIADLFNSESKDSVPVLQCKKSDLFAMKLVKTIESCKAKLGITEISEHEASGSESMEEDSEEDSDNASVTSDVDVVDINSDSSESEDESKSETSIADVDVNDVEKSMTSSDLNASNDNIDVSEGKTANASEKDEPNEKEHLSLSHVNDNEVEIVKAVSIKSDPEIADKTEIAKCNFNKQITHVVESSVSKDVSNPGISLSPTNHSSLDDLVPICSAIQKDPSEKGVNEINRIVNNSDLAEGTVKVSPKFSACPEASHDKDNSSSDIKEQTNLKEVIKKMRCEMDAIKESINSLKLEFKKQQWFHIQEKSELRHNMNVLMMEMRASLEVDKKKAIDFLKKQHEIEKKKTYEEIKKKQWVSDTPPMDKKVILVSVKPSDLLSGKLQSSSSPIIPSTHPCDATSDIYSQSQPMPPQIQFVTSNSPLQLISSNSKLPTLSAPSYQAATNSALQFLLSPIPPSSDLGNKVVPPEIVRTVQDSSDIITKVRSRQTDLGTAIELLKEMNKETAASIPKETKLILNPEDAPGPNSIKVGDLWETDNSISSDDGLPDESVINYEANTSGKLTSDIDDDDDSGICEMVPLGYGIEVNAEALKKCLKYGTTSARLTRLLVDLLFPDISFLAKSSVYGSKSKTALPSREVNAIIDRVKLQFPDCVQNNIVLQMKVKCKEAKMKLRRMGSNSKLSKTKDEKNIKIDSVENVLLSKAEDSSNCELGKSATAASMLRERLSVKQLALTNDTTILTPLNVDPEDRSIIIESKSNADSQSTISYSQTTVPVILHNSLNGHPLGNTGSSLYSKTKQSVNLSELAANKTRSLLPKPQIINSHSICSSVLPISPSPNVNLQHTQFLSHSFQAPSASSYVNTDITNLHTPPLEQSSNHPLLVLGSTLSAALQFGSKSPQVRLKMPASGVPTSVKLAISPAPILPTLLKKGTGESSGIS